MKEIFGLIVLALATASPQVLATTTPIDLPAAIPVTPGLVVSLDTSPDGNLVVFGTENEVLPLPFGVNEAQLYLLDRSTEALEYISAPESGFQMRNAYRPRMSSDGQLISFMATGSSPVAFGPTNVWLWLRDRTEAAAKIASLANGGVDPMAGNTTFDGTIARDAKIPFFRAPDGLVPGDGNGLYDIHSYDLGSQTTSLYSSPVADHATLLDVSDDGRYLVMGFSANAPRRIYRYDRTTSAEVDVVGGVATDPAFYGASRNARYVVFGTSGSSAEGWVFDADSGTTATMSEFFGTRIGLERLSAVRFSPNGEYAALRGSRLLPRSQPAPDIILIRMSDGQVARATQANNGSPGFGGIGGFAILDSGSIVYASDATNLGGSMMTIAYEFSPNAADLAVTILSPGTLYLQDASEAIFEITVTNQGSETVEDAVAFITFSRGQLQDPTVSEPLCVDQQFPVGTSGSRLSCEVGVINPGQSVTFEVSANQENGPNNGAITLDAFAQSAGSFDDAFGNNTASATISVEPGSAPPPPPSGGGGSGGGGGTGGGVLLLLGLLCARAGLRGLTLALS